MPNTFLVILGSIIGLVSFIASEITNRHALSSILLMSGVIIMLLGGFGTDKIINFFMRTQ